MRESAKVASRATRHGGMAQRLSDDEAIKYLTKDEVERLFRVIPKRNVRDVLLFDLVYRYGLRRSEASRLTLNDVRDDKIWIARRKHGRSNAYPLHPRTRALL